ncbi:hypothetical protein BX265_1823 [Streptomyces sp. TLI_235]|nr:hypothetical protein [Streptomyces sp. TLI_235]PBC77086.1 hypothetical protein BX265_1823 [Streptomyces sp. TLI_235]
MTTVAIQPSFGNATARRHWRDTLDREVAFTSTRHASELTPSQHSALLEAHPTGRARFWGATKAQDKNMQRLKAGDVVLFTGKNHVRGVGEVGITFRSKAFADTMWSQDPKNGSWHNVYSLTSFQPTEIPYSEIWALPSFNANDNFMGLRILEDERAEEVLQGLGIETAASARQLSTLESAVVTALAEGTRVVAVENLHTQTAAYQQDAGPVLVHRAEALLVREYTSSIASPKLAIQRLRTPAGITDLHIAGPSGAEIVEAKRSSDHRFVREALAQLLDYAPHSPEPADRLTGLFPNRPADQDIVLLHRYGIDCVYRVRAGAFERSAAPSDNRARMRRIWHS